MASSNLMAYQGGQHMKCRKPKCDGWVQPIDVEKTDVGYDVIHKCNKCNKQQEESYFKDIINIKIGVPFEKLYCADPYEVYKDDIEKFFNDEMIDRWQYHTRSDGIQVAKGKIWVAGHGHFETLAVEPMDGNQFEIAVRFDKTSNRVLDGHRPHHGYSGYAICRLPFRIIGKNTGGH